jgi:predicted dehydrogenase
MTRFLIAGLGSIGRRHLRNLQALGERDVVLLRSGHSTLPEEELAGIPAERDLGTALRRFRPDAIIVATPTALHLETAIPAARAGCHLFIEKPVSHGLQGIDELRAACREGGARVVVGFQFRFHPGLREVRRLLEEGEVGRPMYAVAHWGEYLPDWHPWEDFRLSYAARADLGGGVILTLCHPFDYLRWLIGEVAGVSATTARLGDFGLDVEDTAQISLVFSSGALGAVHLDYIQKPPCHRLEVVGSRGTLRWDDSDGAVRWWREATHGWESVPAPEGFERNSMFLDEMRHFIDVVRGEAHPAVGLEDGARALELALAALASAQDARTFRTVSGAGS